MWVTAVEMAAETTPRFAVARGWRLSGPKFHTAGPHPGATAGPCAATTAHGPDPFVCAQRRSVIEHLVRAHELPRDAAHAVASVAVDLRIGEIVGAPSCIVPASLPDAILSAA